MAKQIDAEPTIREAASVTRSGSKQQAWRTRKLRYGPSGDSRPYVPKPFAYFGNHMLNRLVAVVHGEGMLSEGQIARVTGMTILDVRRSTDMGRDHLHAKPPGGRWAAEMLKRIG